MEGPAEGEARKTGRPPGRGEQDEANAQGQGVEGVEGVDAVGEGHEGVEGVDA